MDNANAHHEPAAGLDCLSPRPPVDPDGSVMLASPPASELIAGCGVVPTIFEPERQEKLLQEFIAEFSPVGPTESMLVAELARHAAAIERWDAGGGAVTRQAIRTLPALAHEITLTGGLDQDTVLAGAMSTEATERCERFSLLRSRAFLKTLDKLQAFQEARRRRTQRCTVLPPLGFADETACEEYLANRLRQSQAVCQQCGAAHGCVLQARKCWECAACGKQMGLRTGTVMARSPVPLRTWFDAVRWVLWRPTISATELSRQVGLERIATARSMLARIRTAMAAEDAGLQLAGLDQHYMRGAANNLSEVSSVAKASNAQN